MKNREMNYRLISALPELKKTYDECVSWQEGDRTGSHVVYGDVLNPAIRIALQTQDMAALARYSNFIEQILNFHDEDADNVIVVTVIEQFLDSPEQKLFRSILGPLGAHEFDAMKKWDANYRKTFEQWDAEKELKNKKAEAFRELLRRLNAE